MRESQQRWEEDYQDGEDNVTARDDSNPDDLVPTVIGATLA